MNKDICCCSQISQNKKEWYAGTGQLPMNACTNSLVLISPINLQSCCMLCLTNHLILRHTFMGINFTRTQLEISIHSCVLSLWSPFHFTSLITTASDIQTERDKDFVSTISRNSEIHGCASFKSMKKPSLLNLFL